MDPLTPLPSCTEEESCVPPAEQAKVGGLTGVDNATGCIRKVANKLNAIPWGDGVDVEMRDGSQGEPIRLDLVEMQDGQPGIVVQSPALAIGSLKADASSDPKVLVSRSGQWLVEDQVGVKCFAGLCECAARWIAGLEEVVQEDGSIKYCLVLVDPEDVGGEGDTVYFADTSTVLHTGSGTAGDPHRFTVKISADANNCIERPADGIYMECGLYQDPLASL